jgi:hypothetical protein
MSSRKNAVQRFMREPILLKKPNGIPHKCPK